MKVISFIILGALATVGAQGPKSKKAETSHLAFVTEYLRELAAIEDIRAAAEKELQQGTKDDVFPNAVHTSTLIQLELRSQIAMLKSMHLNAPFDDLIPNLTAFYEGKIALHQRLIDISSAFVAGPKPGVDYGKLAAEVPKIRAELEYIDRSLFEAAPLIFATLIDKRPDSQNHASHLIITKVERRDLIDAVNRDFGMKLDQKDQNFIVSSASILRTYLLKDYKCSDEPWN